MRHPDLKMHRYAVNVPLRDGITDASYKDIFESVGPCEETFRDQYVLNPNPIGGESSS
jgi:acetoin utilization deacetylase AcuC-like enzyme